MSKHPLYLIWAAMIRRCYNKNTSSYNRYGGRGIKVADEWHDPKTFIMFAEKMPKYSPEKIGRKGGLSIDRINNDGNYEPNNVRWATVMEQYRNSKTFTYSNEYKELQKQL